MTLWHYGDIIETRSFSGLPRCMIGSELKATARLQDMPLVIVCCRYRCPGQLYDWRRTLLDRDRSRQEAASDRSTCFKAYMSNFYVRSKGFDRLVHIGYHELRIRSIVGATNTIATETWIGRSLVAE